MTIPSAAHQALADRERTIYDATIHSGVDAYYEAVGKDRAARWAKLLEGREESGDIREWATQMSQLHSRAGNPVSVVRVFRNVLPWITALYVVRYGEAEDTWPTSLTSDDGHRARKWLRGDIPEGVKHSGGES